MFIKFKIFYYLVFLLVLRFSIGEDNVELSRHADTEKSETSSKTETASANTTYDENQHQLHQLYGTTKKIKVYQRLQAIISEIISKGSREYRSEKLSRYSSKIGGEIFPSPDDQLSLKKPEVEIFATLMNDDTTVPIVTTLTQSSSSSSHFAKYDERRREFRVAKDTTAKTADDQEDVAAAASFDLKNDTTEMHTFHLDREEEATAAQSKPDEGLPKPSDKFDTGNETETDRFSADGPESPDSSVLSDVSEFGTIRRESQEDIPSFREWTEKHLAEEEKERGNVFYYREGDDNITNIPVNGKSPKMRNKNYASLDCGAKLVATNSEAKSAGSLLSNNRDEYLLSACNSKIWFIVELCEAVQLKKIELANFELFSSSPREFSVHISDRFPSRDWSTVGQFTANDIKSVQSFNLQPHHFTKYLKVEFHSHYGKEHFCPISLFRVYGTSEFEVLEIVDGNEELENDGVDNDDDDINEPIISDQQEQKKKKLETSNNLFGSARDAVINMVKKAAEVLVPQQNAQTFSVHDTGGDGENRSKLILFIKNCITPRYSILCRQCPEEFFNRVYFFISCYLKELQQMLQKDLIWRSLIKYNVCVTFGIVPLYSSGYLTMANYTRSNDFYPLSLLPKEMLAAFCNLVAIDENRTKQNVTSDDTQLANHTSRKCEKPNLADTVYSSVPLVADTTTTAALNMSTSSFKIIEHSTLPANSYDTNSLSLQIKPTKTLSRDSDVPLVVTDPSANTVVPIVGVFHETLETETKMPANEDNETPKEEPNVPEMTEDTISLDSLISELEKSEDASQHGSSTSTQTSSAPKPSVQKESVFVRLANRIKALERNMSLSSQYLEELSRRYKKQVEDVQRILTEVAEDKKKNSEREQNRVREINGLTQNITFLTAKIAILVAEKESWSYKALMVGEHSLIILLEIVIFLAIMCMCRGVPRVEISKRKFSLEWRKCVAPVPVEIGGGISVKRRQSLDDLTTFNKPLKAQKRRPSEEALKMDGATHQELLIYETNRSSRSENRRKRKKRKELILKSNANAINLETGHALVNKKSSLNRVMNAPLSRSASTSEIDEHGWGRIEYVRINHNERKHNIVENAQQNENRYPPFFKTAASVRTKRLSEVNGRSNLTPVFDVSSDQDSSLPSTPVKEKKVNGIKKIVKKFF